MQLLTLRSWQNALLLHSCKAVMQAVMHVNGLLIHPVICFSHGTGLVHFLWQLSYKL